MTAVTTPRKRRTGPEAPVRLAGVSVVLPCHDEEGNIDRVLREWRTACSEVAREWELIVVDDGSHDDTGRIAADAAMLHRDVRLIVHPRNLGYGAAVRSGIRAARMPWTFLTDGDGQFDGADLAAAVALAGDHDVVAGYREERADGPLRRANGAAWSGLMRLLLRVPVRDVDCAFKLMRSSVVRDLPLTSSGAMVSAELLARAVAVGARTAEIPVAHRPRIAGRSSGAQPAVIARAFGELFRVRRSLA